MRSSESPENSPESARWRYSRPAASAAAVASIWLAVTTSAFSQPAECAFAPDERNPTERILRCDATLVVRQAPGTVYHPVDGDETRQPKALQVDEGAVLVEFHPSPRHPTFQILTPHAIAAVRGTRWAVEVGAQKTSTFVISGIVAVKRPNVPQTVLLRPGQGADVSPDSGPIVVKRWKPPRVRALLARFGE
jgi:ferric-dicitrate binding protein FerR (iron transport regulator)